MIVNPGPMKEGNFGKLAIRYTESDGWIIAYTKYYNLDAID